MARLSWIIVALIAAIQVSQGASETVSFAATTKAKTKPTTATSTDSAKLARAQAPTTKSETNVVPGVIPLTARTFASSVGDGNLWLIEFHSPGCGHCEAFAPSYSAIADAYHASPNKHKIKIAKVDGSAETALSSRFGVYGYPSFYLVDGWSVYIYDDARTKKKLMEFVEGGYKKQDPIPIYSSPMGPVGVFQGLLISSGIVAGDFFEGIQKRFGLSPVLAGVAMFGAVFYGCFFAIVALALCVKPTKRKRD
jgi:thiol-disulfide isomerase/thioredoxin